MTELFTRRGRMIVRAQLDAKGLVWLQCPALKREHSGVMLPSQEGTRYILADDCRLYTFDWAWGDFFDSGVVSPHNGPCGELVNVSLALLNKRLPSWSAQLDDLFGPGAGAAAQILTQDARLGLRELLATMTGAGAQAKRNRAQAIVQFPLFCGLLRPAGLAQPGRDATFTRLVDKGAPLMTELPKLFDSRPWVIRHLRGLTANEIAPYHANSVGVLIENMNWLTPERAPTEQRHYELLTNLSSGDLARRWILAAARRSVLRNGWSEFNVWAEHLNEITDYCRFVQHLAAGLDARDSPESVDKALGQPTFRQVFRLSEQWHRIEESIRTEFPVEPESHFSQSWKPLFEEYFEIEGFQLRCLRTNKELEDEGRALKHCVASYGDRCEAGQAHIIRITRDGQAIATAELRLNGRRGGKRAVVIQQVKGMRNARPEAKVKEAVDELICELEGKDLSEFPDGSERSTRRAITVTSLFEQALKHQGLAALDRYRPCLQPNPTQTALWGHVLARYSSHLHGSSEVSGPQDRFILSAAAVAAP